MSDIESIIQGELEDPRAVFVFHHEVTARFWLRRAFRLTPRRTLPEGRFIAWDEFKRRTFRYPAAGREASLPDRSLFLAALLQRNAREGVFRGIIPPRHRAHSAAFLRSLREILPRLDRIHEVAEGVMAEEKRADLLDLLRRYREHLARCGRFEPAFERPRFEPGGYRYILLHPEIIEELSFHAPLLLPHPEVRVEPTDFSRAPAEPRLEVFETGPEELTALLLRVGGLLDDGVPPEQVVLTVAGLEELEPALRIQAARHGVPLSFHLRRPVGGYPQARLFRALARWVESGFSLDALKALLLNRAVPWRDEAQMRGLVQFGVENRVVRNYALRGADLDLWETSFARTIRQAEARETGEGRLRALQRLYRRLRAGAEGIVRAPGFRELKERLGAFTDDFLDTGRWSESDGSGTQPREVYQYALNTLNELLLACREGDDPGPPFQVWLEYLEDRPYVPQEERARVQVYPYRVTAGIRPDHHFVLNASQDGTRRVIARYPFLTIQEEPDGERETDLSDTYLRTYSLSGGAVRFSYARQSARGAQLPASFFLAGGRIEPAGPAAAAGDLYTVERRMWSGALSLAVTRLHPAQKTGFLRALATGLRAKEADLTARALADGELRERVWRRLVSRSDGLLPISPTLLERYHGCPFQFLFQRGLGVEELPFTPVLWEPREMGVILHRVFQRFYRLQQGRPLRPERLAELRREMLGEARAVLAEYELDNPLPLLPVWEEKSRQVLELAEAFLEVELRELPGQEVLDTEASFEEALPGEGWKLTGTIDRISRVDGRVGVVDYKKRAVPGREDIFGEEAFSFQVPFYVHLLQRKGWNPEWAAYYSIEERRYRFVFHPDRPRPYAGAEEVRLAVEALQERILDMIRGIRQGEFRPGDRAGKTACLFCPLRGLCRNRFVTWG